MSQATIVSVTDATFQSQVLSADGPVLVKFEADWCGPCQAMKPAVAEIAEEFAGKLTVATLDIDQNAQTPYRYGVRGVPTVMLFKNGEVVGQKVGLARKKELADLLNAQIA